MRSISWFTDTCKSQVGRIKKKYSGKYLTDATVAISLIKNKTLHFKCNIIRCCSQPGVIKTPSYFPNYFRLLQASPTQRSPLAQRATSASPTSTEPWCPLLPSSPSSRRACSMWRLKSASMRSVTTFTSTTANWCNLAVCWQVRCNVSCKCVRVVYTVACLVVYRAAALLIFFFFFFFLLHKLVKPFTLSHRSTRKQCQIIFCD